ncbi:unnamed protein product, partial [Ixodes hexagonus]
EGGDHDDSTTRPQETLGCKREIEGGKNPGPGCSLVDGDAFGDCEPQEKKKRRQGTSLESAMGSSQVSTANLDKQHDPAAPSSRHGWRGAGDAFATDGSTSLVSPSLSPVVDVRGRRRFSYADDAEVPDELQFANRKEHGDIVADLGGRYVYRVPPKRNGFASDEMNEEPY